MPTKVIIGAQWGDEGKGKITDIHAQNAQMVVRSQGGDNAGHTVVIGSETHKLHLIPSGIFNPETKCIIGPGVVINPENILAEIDNLEAQGISTKNLFIDTRAHVIMPYHIALDELSERSLGNNSIGTTCRGIGPCYTDKTERSGIRVCDLIRPETMEKRLKSVLPTKNAIIEKVYDGQPLDLIEILSKYIPYGRRLKKYVADTTVMTHEAVKNNENILFEGAQAVLLDLDLGTYPYVTSSHPVAGGACIGAGIGPTAIDECIGIAKAYTTRVGKGPFPTELNNEVGDHIREKGAEFGTTTGRPRRCGWFDAVVVRYAARTSSLTSIAINKLDTLSGLGNLKICVNYEKNGETITNFPPTLDELAECTPIYEDLVGWDEDISNVRSYSQLPRAAQLYIEKIGETCGARVSIVGVGPGRDQVIYRD